MSAQVGIPIAVGIILGWICILRLAYNLGRAIYRDTHRAP